MTLFMVAGSMSFIVASEADQTLRDRWEAAQSGVPAHPPLEVSAPVRTRASRAARIESSILPEHKLANRTSRPPLNGTNVDRCEVFGRQMVAAVQVHL